VTKKTTWEKKEWTVNERRKKKDDIHGSLKDTFLASI